MTPELEALAEVVAWLRNPATAMMLCKEYAVYRKDGQPTAATQQNRGVGFMFLTDAAAAIERGEFITPTQNHKGPHDE